MKKRLVSIFLIVSIVASIFAVSAVSISAATTSLAPPTLGKVSNYDGFINVNWSRVSGAAKYCMWYKVGNNPKWNSVYTTKTYWNIQHPVPGTKFTIKISAVNYWGEHSAKYSNEKIIRYVNPPKITSVMQCNYHGAHGLMIEWTNVSLANKYRLFYRYRKSKSDNWSNWKWSDITRNRYDINLVNHAYICTFYWTKLEHCTYFEIKICAKAYGHLSCYSNLVTPWCG